VPYRKHLPDAGADLTEGNLTEADLTKAVVENARAGDLSKTWGDSSSGVDLAAPSWAWWSSSPNPLALKAVGCSPRASAALRGWLAMCGCLWLPVQADRLDHRRGVETHGAAQELVLEHRVVRLCS
jgi:hypothetical protein